MQETVAGLHAGAAAGAWSEVEGIGLDVALDLIYHLFLERIDPGFNVLCL